MSRPPYRSLLLISVAIVTLLTGCGSSDDSSHRATSADGNVFAELPQTVADSPRLTAAAKQVAADGDADGAASLERIATVPTGIWLTPERYGANEVGPYVAGVVASTEGGTVPLFVLYGVPDRDCTGGYSTGGLTTDTYLPWVQAIADAATTDGATSAAVLEPDAVAGSVSCGGADRLSLLHDALGILTDAGLTTYVDAGHSDWLPASTMARLLRKVGVENGRGFATNASNYQPEASERAYAAELSSLLDGAHYVIDVGRDGDPSGSGKPVKDWCNPPDRALGESPGYVDDGSPLDALLWIKPPAESDGECHGGPPAGDIWVARALELAAGAGW
ncbi:hypothetical protein BH09ACT12_BH09ACT12_36430 [soil metagenome]